LDESEITSNKFKRSQRQSQKAISHERPYSELLHLNNSVSTQNVNTSLPPTQVRQKQNKNPNPNNPFSNISNLSGVFES